MDYERLDYFQVARSPTEIAELAASHGDIPKGDIFSIQYRDVLSWGRPWWRVCMVVYGRNSRKDNLTDEDDFETWKALLFTLADMLKTYYLPRRMRGTTCAAQWREDIFADAASYLWLLVRQARGKSLRIRDTAWIAITRACRSSGVQKVPQEFDSAEFLSSRRHVVDVAHKAAENLDRLEDDRLLDRRVAVRLEYRLSESFYPGAKAIYKSIKSGDPSSIRKHRWMAQLVEIHRRLVRHALENRRAS